MHRKHHTGWLYYAVFVTACSIQRVEKCNILQSRYANFALSRIFVDNTDMVYVCIARTPQS